VNLEILPFSPPGGKEFSLVRLEGRFRWAHRRVAWDRGRPWGPFIGASVFVGMRMLNRRAGSMGVFVFDDTTGTAMGRERLGRL
jgi:hypothetical protein